jgi:16S rRNA processing protein RimM
MTVYGVRGWLKIESGTRPAGNILHYRPWWLLDGDRWAAVEVDAGEVSGKRVLAHFAGVDDRDLARQFCQRDIHVEAAQLPALAEGEYYWHQLIGLEVFGRAGMQRVSLGRVTDLLETGAHDVLVVRRDEGFGGLREQLIPYADAVVLAVDLAAGTMDVDWDRDY